MLRKMNPCYGKTIRITFMKNILLNVLNITNHDGTFAKRLFGFEKNLLDALSSSLNFSYNLIETKEFAYGTKLKNNTWTGAVGLLHRNEVDVAITKLTDTYQRRSAIDFSLPYFVDTFHFFIGRLHLESRNAVFFLSPFGNKVWLALLILYIIVIAFLYCQKFKKKDIYGPLFYVIGVSLNQGAVAPTTGLSSSIVVAIWILSCNFLAIHYYDALTSSTSVVSHDVVDTLEQMAFLFERGKMKIVITKGNFLANFIKNLPTHGKLFYSVTEIRPYSKRDFDDINAGLVTMIFGEKRMALFLRREKRPELKFHKVKSVLRVQNIALGFRKNFSCAEAFNSVIAALWESGCLSKWDEVLMRFSRKRSIEETEDTNKISYIKLEDLRGTFLLVTVGLTISCLVLIWNFISMWELYYIRRNYRASLVWE